MSNQSSDHLDWALPDLDFSPKIWETTKRRGAHLMSRLLSGVMSRSEYYFYRLPRERPMLFLEVSEEESLRVEGWAFKIVHPTNGLRHAAQMELTKAVLLEGLKADAYFPGETTPISMESAVTWIYARRLPDPT